MKGNLGIGVSEMESFAQLDGCVVKMVMAQ